ncbi:MAG: DUF3991 and toprim domain-containing protein [Oscillospiraceae bacterium]|nr:DUF3991 and toprim domain-containing protein [Oscillospiraceae bacterium]
MGWVTKEQIERARQVSVLDYVLRYESGNIKRVGNEYRLRDHESLAIGEKGFYWHSREIGGKTALDYLVNVRGYGLADAVCLLIHEHPHDIEHSSKPETPYNHSVSTLERLLLVLPRRNTNNNRVIAYLQSRGIDKGVILDCIERGDLYESANFHDCVFKGKDEIGKTRCAAIRSTTAAFKRDADGSDKKYSFILPPEVPDSNIVAVFESGIDCLSHQTLCKQGYIPQFGGWRLSLGGTSVLGLEYFLELHPQIIHCLACTDNDEAGNHAADRIMELPGITTERIPPVNGCDWNDTLMAAQKAERTQNKARHSNEPYI